VVQDLETHRARGYPGEQKPDCGTLQTGLSWPDIPNERDARIVAKRVAEELCGKSEVRDYINLKGIKGLPLRQAPWLVR